MTLTTTLAFLGSRGAGQNPHAPHSAASSQSLSDYVILILSARAAETKVLDASGRAYSVNRNYSIYLTIYCYNLRIALMSNPSVHTAALNGRFYLFLT